MAFSDTYILLNDLEAVLWLSISLILFFRVSRVTPAYKSNTIWSGLFFFLFGLSDIAEAKIGGIFEPAQYWLLAIKVACVLAFIVLFMRYEKIRRGSMKK